MAKRIIFQLTPKIKEFVSGQKVKFSVKEKRQIIEFLNILQTKANPRFYKLIENLKNNLIYSESLYSL